MLNQEKGNLKILGKLCAFLPPSLQFSYKREEGRTHIGWETLVPYYREGRADFINKLFCMSVLNCLGTPEALVQGAHLCFT